MERRTAVRNVYRWNSPVTPLADDEIKKLKEEERHLDAWIQLTTEQVEEVESYITSQHLAPLLEEDSSALAIATPRKSILHLPHKLEQQHETGHHTFTLIPPNAHDPRRCMLPKVFLLESGESMCRLSLTPPPPLLEKCCSDFHPFLNVWDDASDDAQSILRGLARSQNVVIKPEVKEKNEAHLFEMIKDNNHKATEAFAPMNHALMWDTSHAMNHALMWDSSHEVIPHDAAIKKAPQDDLTMAQPHAMNHALLWDSSHEMIPHDAPIKKAPQDDSTIAQSHPWEVASELELLPLLQMVEQLPMPTLLERESSSLVLCEGG